MDTFDNVGSRDIQDFITALKALKVFQRWGGILQHGAHRTISDDNTVRERTHQFLGSSGHRQLSGVFHLPNSRLFYN